MTPLPVGSTLHFNSAFRTPHPALDLPPLANPLVVQDGNDASLLQHFDAGGIAVCLPVEGVRHARVDDQLRAHHAGRGARSEEHTSELQSRLHLVCRLLLEKKKKKTHKNSERTSIPNSIA